MHFASPDGKKLGRLNDNIYVTFREPRHFFRIFNGFGISESVLRSLPSDVDTLQFHYYKDKKTTIYQTSVAKMITSNTWIDNGDFQYVMDINEMEVIE